MENQQQQNTPLCRANCGFYGSPATEDMCSKCFKDMIKRKQETGNPATTTNAVETIPADTIVEFAASDGAMVDRQRNTSSPENKPKMNSASSGTTASTSSPEGLPSSDASTTTESTTNTSNASPSPVPTQQQEDAQQKKKPNRCGVCNKRVGLTGFECRCGGLFCGEHRYDSAHNCTFDYKTAGREELRAKHPQVITDKIERI